MNSAAVGLGETPVKQKRKNEENGAVWKEAEKKRDKYLSWDDYFMAIACLSAQRSKDPSTQVGACIVSPEKKIVGIGYNGMPNGCSDDLLPWGKTSDNVLDNKYPYVCHAEMNAIMNKNAADTKGCTMYTALFPCNECAKLIIQAGITHIVYQRDKPKKNEMIASKRLLDMAGIHYKEFQTETEKIVIDFAVTEQNNSCKILTRMESENSGDSLDAISSSLLPDA